MTEEIIKKGYRARIEQLKKDNEQLEKMVLALILAHKITIQTLFRDNIEMTMSTHVVISAQDRKLTEIRSNFEKYAKDKPNLLKEFKKAENFDN